MLIFLEENCKIIEYDVVCETQNGFIKLKNVNTGHSHYLTKEKYDSLKKHDVGNDLRKGTGTYVIDTI